MGTAIVIGGGIGGLTAAVALRRAGWRVEVYERAAAIDTVGSGVSIAPNAVKALDYLGLRGSFDTVAGRLDGMEIRLRSGRRISHARGAMIESRYGAPLTAMHRADLHRVLTDALGDTPLRTGHTVTGVEPDGTATFDGPRGPVTVTADLIVAADGVHSTARRRLFPTYPGPEYAGYPVWRGIVPADRARGIDFGDRLSESWGRARRFGVVPFADGRVYWYASETLPAGARLPSGAADVLARFAGWHDPIPQLIAATPDEAILRHDVHYLRQPLPSFVRGRVALLGDASHAVTPDIGQGACLAIEDAVHLTEVLGKGVDEGLHAYDEARRPRTTLLATRSGRIGRIIQTRSGTAAFLRDLTADLTPATISMRTIGSIYEWNPPVG
ncbi:FAD-dependent monooxygenase [Phytomonospora sp. NPDC050363]|uniref:FAD-dependent monooxygenase n=1 Tax=Phytomonospora sp. NPDC050363 TaxID=3155642 RepID=UPI00340C5D9A